jgi:hypothetical protein
MGSGSRRRRCAASRSVLHSSHAQAARLTHPPQLADSVDVMSSLIDYSLEHKVDAHNALRAFTARIRQEQGLPPSAGNHGGGGGGGPGYGGAPFLQQAHSLIPPGTHLPREPAPHPTLGPPGSPAKVPRAHPGTPAAVPAQTPVPAPASASAPGTPAPQSAGGVKRKATGTGADAAPAAEPPAKRPPRKRGRPSAAS